LLGLEALVRWQHPVEGWIPPTRFIPMAERAHLIDTLGERVLSSACGLLRVLRAERLDVARVAVNVSPVQLRKPDFVDRVEGVIMEAGGDVNRLELEVTESTLLANPEVSIANMTRLRDLGIRVAIDDFGVGYSSLAMLRQLPLDCLKIDASFVAALPGDANASAIIRAIMAMAHALRLEVLAEGVETEEQAGFLAGAGCDSAQGYLYAKPMPVKELLAWLKARQQT
jgi:EAL domain-containing protein (putative c-di-GMP-specific phosphodiesterase class I)